MSCPHPDVIRLLAEGEPVDAADAAHAASCARCARRLDLAREEEAALRAALAAPPPRDLLERTLAAVRQERGDTPRPARTGRRRAARSSPGAGPGLALGVVVLVVIGALLVARRSSSPRPDGSRPQAPPPAVTERPAPPTTEPARPAPVSERAPDAPDAPDAPAEAAPDDDEWTAPIEVEAPDESGAPIVPDAPDEPDVVAQAPDVPDAPPASPDTSARVVARVRRGALGTLRAGDAVPPGAALRAGADGAEVEADDAVVVTLAPRTTARFAEEAAGVVVGLERGRALARTAGARPWAVATPEGRLVPLGTALLVQRDGARTRAATLEGLVRLEPAGRAADGLDLRPGFEAELARGRPLVARPLVAAARALAWLPDDRRPAPPSPPEPLAMFEFDDGPGRWTKGAPQAGGARGSRGCLRGVPGASDYAVSVELEDLAGVVTVEPDLWLEAVVRVDRRALVALQVWDHDRKENLAHRVTVEPGRWTSVAAPLRAFTGPGGEPRGPVLPGGKGTCVTVFAGEEGQALELLVDDVRAWRQR